MTAERDELGDIKDQGPWEREDEQATDEPAEAETEAETEQPDRDGGR
jgi:hypothetical protein